MIASEVIKIRGMARNESALPPMLSAMFFMDLW